MPPQETPSQPFQPQPNPWPPQPQPQPPMPDVQAHVPSARPVPTAQPLFPTPIQPTANTQSPATPTPPTASEPTPTPPASNYPPQPQQTAHTPQPATYTTPAATQVTPTHKSTKKRSIIIAAAVAALVVLAITFAALILRTPGVTLETYSNDTYSVLVPKGYTKSASGADGLTFREATGKDDTRSEVVVFYRTLPAGLTDSGRAQLKASFKENLLSAAQSSSENGATVVNGKTTDITFKGTDAVKLTAESKKDGKKVGDYTLIAGLNTKGMYIIGVGAHKSDPALAKKTDQIINSFTLK